MNSGQKQQWLALVRRTLPGRLAAHSVASALADRLNGKTGQLNPSHQTLANDCGLCERTSKRAIRELLNADLIEITRPDGRGRGSSNHYRLKGVSAVTLKGKKGCHDSHPKTPKRVTERTPERGTEMAHEPKGMNPHSGAPLEAAPGVEVHDRLGPAVPSPEGLKAKKAAMAELRRVLAPKDVLLECSE